MKKTQLYATYKKKITFTMKKKLKGWKDTPCKHQSKETWNAYINIIQIRILEYKGKNFIMTN